MWFCPLRTEKLCPTLEGLDFCGQYFWEKMSGKSFDSITSYKSYLHYINIVTNLPVVTSAHFLKFFCTYFILFISSSLMIYFHLDFSSIKFPHVYIKNQKCFTCLNRIKFYHWDKIYHGILKGIYNFFRFWSS